MSNQQDSSSKGWIIIITSVIGAIATITVAYFAFRGNTEPKQLEIHATQTSESLQSTQMADNVWITETAQSIEATKFAESIMATQTSVALNSNSTGIQNMQATQTPYPTYTPIPTDVPPTALPPSPVGQWTVMANGYSGILNINTLNNGNISGTIFDNPIEGTWNEFTQAITFKRINSPDPNVYQLFYGEQIKQGNMYILTGYFEEHNGNRVDTYNWNAER